MISIHVQNVASIGMWPHFAINFDYFARDILSNFWQSFNFPISSLSKRWILSYPEKVCYLVKFRAFYIFWMVKRNKSASKIASSFRVGILIYR